MPEKDDDEPRGMRYPCANGTKIFVYESADNAGRSPATGAGWFVDELDATIATLGARGVVFDAGRFRAAWVKDPGGNTFALTQNVERG